MQNNTYRSTVDYTRLRQALKARRAAARGRREIASVLARNHGNTVREELLARLEGT
jgi:hypothetical protein